MCLSAAGRAPRFSRVGGALLAFAGVVATSALLAPGPAPSARVALLGGARLLALCALAVAAAETLRGPRAHALLGALALATGSVVLAGAFEQLAGDGWLGQSGAALEATLLEPFRVKASVTDAGARRLSAGFVHANLAAAWLAAALPACLLAARDARIGPWLGRIGALGVGWALCATLSRAGLVAGLVAATAVALLAPLLLRREARLRWALALVGVVATVAASPSARSRWFGRDAGLYAAALVAEPAGAVRLENHGTACWRPFGRDRHRLVAEDAQGHERAAFDLPERVCPGAALRWTPPEGSVRVRFEHHGLHALASVRLGGGDGAAREGQAEAPRHERAPDQARPLGRAALWRTAARLASERPLLGWGPDSFRLRKGGDPREHANNLALEVAADLGIIGLLALLWLAATALAAVWRLSERAWVLAAGGALLAYAGHGVLDCVIYFYGASLPLGVALGVVLGAEAGGASAGAAGAGSGAGADSGADAVVGT